MSKSVRVTIRAIETARSGGLYVEEGVETQVLRNGIRRDREIVEIVGIGEESSDFLIQYGVSSDGALYLIVKPSYVEDLPAHINTSAQLRDVIEFAIQEAAK